MEVNNFAVPINAAECMTADPEYSSFFGVLRATWYTALAVVPLKNIVTRVRHSGTCPRRVDRKLPQPARDDTTHNTTSILLDDKLRMDESSNTYEATVARRSAKNHPDKIHWDGKASFRDQPYRSLHHQNGCIGVFHVRLLEARQLQRSYWSALALGPLRHLGLSTAHGDVSAYCTFTLKFVDEYPTVVDGIDASNLDAKKPATTYPHASAAATTAAAAASHAPERYPVSRKVVSPVIRNNSNPVWEKCQFDLPLWKGAMRYDGMRIVLEVRVAEDATTVENIIPGIPSGGDSRLLGIGEMDLTDLCLGVSTKNGFVVPSVRDWWIPISMPRQEFAMKTDESLSYNGKDPLAPLTPPGAAAVATVTSSASSTPAPSLGPPNKIGTNPSAVEPKMTGQVRVLVTYDPIGMEPQPKDVVALEAFARRCVRKASCSPVIQPLMPLTVVERKGSYLLCEHVLREHQHSHHHYQQHRNHRKALVRLHRNTVFVVERQNLGDAVHNLALLPVDMVLATPMGQAVGHAIAPAAVAVRELFMPAYLFFKLLWMAARTTTIASFSGVQALGSTLWSEGASSLTESHRRRQQSAGPVDAASVSTAVASFPLHQRSASATVQL